ncbi:MAG: lytic murein transglycosylase [Candidatus Pacebacteria bacterium]|nr:lytic murein transglycosylase [Candidatus Paceibacterota bacterium]
MLPAFVFASTPEEERAKLEQELRDLESLISEYEKDITKTEKEKKTLQNELSVLRTKINKLAAQINQSNVMIKDLNYQIGDTEESITQTSLRIEESKRNLAGILQSIYEQDQRSLLEILLAEEEMSDFFDNVAALEALNAKNREVLAEIKNLKNSLESQKTALDQEKGELERVVKLTAVQKQQSEATQKEKNTYLKMTEAEYQAKLKEKQEAEKRAAEIRTRIFELIGIPEAPTFGEALEIAKYVERITGVRAAFLLAILTQESNIGKNVGQCYLKDSKTGAGVVIKSGNSISKVMSPTRDVPVFLTIAAELERDPYGTPVSCPMSYGWGGAMGPAQFIPATWKVYREEVKGVTGRPADPWLITDAFLAAGFYLADYGAANQTYNGEFNAALSYFAGPNWKSSSYASVYKRDYGNPVMAITKNYEADIAELAKADK